MYSKCTEHGEPDIELTCEIYQIHDKIMGQAPENVWLVSGWNLVAKSVMLNPKAYMH